MAMHEKQKNGLVFEDCNGVELPILEDVSYDSTDAAGVDIATNYNTSNLANHPVTHKIP